MRDAGRDRNPSWKLIPRMARALEDAVAEGKVSQNPVVGFVHREKENEQLRCLSDGIRRTLNSFQVRTTHTSTATIDWKAAYRPVQHSQPMSMSLN